MSHPSPADPTPETARTYTAFSGTRRIAQGTLSDVAIRAKRQLDRVEAPQILVFDDATGAVVDIDLRGSVTEVTTLDTVLWRVGWVLVPIGLLLPVFRKKR